MTNLINQISINGELTSFYNYVNPAVKLENVRNFGLQTILFNDLFGADDNTWVEAGDEARTEVRFPVPWETITGAIVPNTSTQLISSRARFKIQASPSSDFDSARINATNGDGSTGTNISFHTVPKSIFNSNLKAIAICNKYAYLEARFNDNLSACYWWYVGWAKDYQYVGGQYPRNAVAIYGNSGVSSPSRVGVENGTSKASFTTTLPAINCEVPTPGADSKDILLIDLASPNNYIGKLWNMIALPSSAVIGKIYKNTGIDPDTGQVETDQKAYWMCVGTWGTDKIGMRVWTENIY